eukprot:6175370-Pleurochrysis_carterae.AAC.3
MVGAAAVRVRACRCRCVRACALEGRWREYGCVQMHNGANGHREAAGVRARREKACFRENKQLCVRVRAQCVQLH